MQVETARGWIDDKVSRLQRHGYREVPADRGLSTYGTVRVLRRADFRVSWLFTRLHTFVILRQVATTSMDDVAAFTRDAVEWARSAKTKGGAPTGLQSGVAVLPVTVTGRAYPDAVNEACRRPDRILAALGLPVLVELETGEAHTYSGDMTWGLLYRRFLGRQQQTVVGDLQGSTLSSKGKLRRKDPVKVTFGQIFRAWFRESGKLTLIGVPVVTISMFIAGLIAGRPTDKLASVSILMPFLVAGAAPWMRGVGFIGNRWRLGPYFLSLGYRLSLFFLGLVWFVFCMFVGLLTMELVLQG